MEAKFVGRGDANNALGWSVGVTAGGLFLTALGGFGDAAGGALSLSGIGAALGVPVAVVSTGAVMSGLANAGAGVRGLMSTGSGAAGGEVWNGRNGVDFAQSSALYPAGSGQRSVVKIEYSGSRRDDIKAANKAGGFDRTPKEYTWHHLDDYDPATNSGTMQLVDTSHHLANAPHAGGVKQFEMATKSPYKR